MTPSASTAIAAGRPDTVRQISKHTNTSQCQPRPGCALPGSRLQLGAAVAGLEIGTRTGPVPVRGVVGLGIAVINFLLLKYY